MSTITWQEVLNQISQLVGNRHIEAALGASAVNRALTTIWNFADFRETMAEFPPFWLAPMTQDYGAPLAVIPDDFLGLRTADLVAVSSDPISRIPLSVRRELRKTHWQGFPEAISYEASVKKLRIFPLTPSNMGSADYMIDGTYKKKPVLVRATALNNTYIPFDDLYQDVIYQVLLWKYLQLIGDQRAGQIQRIKGQGTVYTGQMGMAYDALNYMVEEEAVNLGESFVAPAEVFPRGIM